MRFRSYITLALAVTALTPFLAFTWLQTIDMNRSIERADMAQTQSAERVASVLRERLRSVQEIALLADSLLKSTPLQSASTPRVEETLEEIVRSFPILSNLHLDRVGNDGTVRVLGFYPRLTTDGEVAAGQRHDNRWHAQPFSNEVSKRVRFSPVILSAQKTPTPLLTFAVSDSERGSILSGALELSKLFEDLKNHIELVDADLIVLDASRQIIYPQSTDNRIRKWNAQGLYTTEVKLNDIAEQFPNFTVVVSRSEKTRVSEATNLQIRTTLVGFLVAIFTVIVGFATAKPLREAVEKLFRELHGDSQDNTIRTGPLEIQEYQSAYRAMRLKVEDRTQKLMDLNRSLSQLVEQRSRELTAEELLFRQVFNEIEDAVLLIDKDWMLRESNKTAEQMLSAELKSYLLDKCRSHHTEADANGHEEAFVEKSPLPDDDRRFECRIFHFNSLKSGWRDGFCILVRDVTSREKLDEMKENLIGIVAHELKTPITTCQLQLESFERDTGPSKATQAMREDLDHLKRLVSDWLSVVKIDAGTYAVHPEFIQLTPLAAKARRYVSARHAFKFICDIAEDAECQYADPGALLELFVNLFTNACRYAKPGEVPQIRFCARRIGENVEIAVKDAGIGIAPENREKIFERFFRVMSGRKNAAGGTGLGLVISRAICRAHGGTIVADEEDGMTVFRIRLPQPEFDVQDDFGENAS